MTPLILTGICAAIAVVTLSIAVIKLSHDEFSGWGFLAAITCAIAVIMAILVPLVTYGSRNQGRISCRSFASQTGYPTKFVLLNSWDTGTCLARTRSGRWVPKGQLVGVSR